MDACRAPSAFFVSSPSSIVAAAPKSFNCSLNRQVPRALHSRLRANLRKSGPNKSFQCNAIFSGDAEIKESVDKYVNDHKVVLFMKGTKLFPQCGFSNTVVQILNSLNVPYETVNILENDALRQGLKAYSNWPTFPQLYIDGEFFGGCDITLEAYQSGQLKEVVEKAMCS